jgi:hypothetical protein
MKVWIVTSRWVNNNGTAGDGIIASFSTKENLVKFLMSKLDSPIDGWYTSGWNDFIRVTEMETDVSSK